jgi:RHH-type transcriptional regulator, proline utilization regulon repressor / proline dehydrogenase / delta 1-pyrroline-5-carboxylate dehydrogenase
LRPGDPETNSATMSDAFEHEVQAVARRIAEAGVSERSRLFHLSRWTERTLDWALAHPQFKTQLFRFVDVFPACRDDADVLRHLAEYFENVEVPRALALGLGAAELLPFGAAISAAAARRNIVRMARQLIAGPTPEAALPQLARLWQMGEAATVDLLGERTLSEADAARYATRVAATLEALVGATRAWPPQPHLERDPWGAAPRVNVSVKPTALSPRFGPLTAADGLAEARARLLPILRCAREADATIHLDSEHDEVKDLTFELLRTLGEEFPDGPQLGAVVQAYRKDAFDDLRELTAWSARALRRPLVIRLVKGAYWDFETVVARAQGWPVPVFELKAATDANYERCVRYLVEHAGAVRPACGSHNLRSIACAIVAARACRLPDTALEHQLLYGMAEPVHAALCRLGMRVRVYAPVGDLVTGMAYLVRRLLENTSNESFVRHRFAEGQALEALIVPPGLDASELSGPAEASRRGPTDPAAPTPFANEPHAELRRPAARDRLAAAVAAAPASFGFEAPVLIEGRPAATAGRLVSVDPGNVATVVCRSGWAGPAETEQAIEAARRAFPAWHSTPWRERAAVLFRAGDIMRRRRTELAALEVFEAGKPQTEADADVCEAIDFCEYYGREAVRLEAGVPLAPVPGETTSYRYEPRGIGAVIAPWNFPLAIPAGMVGAALVTGNAVLFKPAEQTPGIALRLVEILLEAGAPPGALAFLPGVGEEAGAYLVDHPDVAFIAFTGSKAVGLELVERAARHRPGQRHVKRVVAEMGGKNAIVVDSDADLEQAVPGIVTSAFAYAGQKCSAAARVIALAPILDELVERLVGATAAVPVGHARELSTVVGPLIDGDAFERVRRYQEIAAEEGEIVYRREAQPAGGWYVGPMVVIAADPRARIASEEIFGPLLTVLRADDFEHALALANDTEYALTGGLYSRSPARIRHAAQRFRAGNFYVNRPVTGALVGRQPFGGHGLSGVGSKAGGPDYLLQFVEPRVVTESTLRRGFVGEE